MKSDLASALLRAIQSAGPREALIVPGDRVAVAVSGGADSVALLCLLEDLRDSLGISLLIAHFDHALRKNSAADARFVEKLAKSRRLPFIGIREDVAAAAARNKWNIEDAGRRLRYQFFAGLVEQGRAHRVAVAHTMDDQAETVLARMLRGTGPAGLAGILPIAGPVIRPLLGFRRAELRSYLRRIKQRWREDQTNGDTRRQRANIRKHLLPRIEKNFSPAIVSHLSVLASLAREEEVFWGALVEDRFRALGKTHGERRVVAVESLLCPLPLALPSSAQAQRPLTERLVRRLYQEVRGHREGLTAHHVEQVIRLAERSQSGRRIELPGSIIAERSFGEIVFRTTANRRAQGQRRPETSQPQSAYHYVVSFDGGTAADVRVPELGTCFRLKVIDWSRVERETSVRETSLDLDRLSEPLVLRSWRSGDSYRPQGRRNRRKLKDMFIAGRIARSERALWPVLESGGRIVWVRGMAPADEFSAGKGTRTGVVIEECKL